jgi:hypothetical protein
MAESGDAIWLHTHHRITVVELAECTGLSETVVRELVEVGALTPADPGAAEWSFSAEAVGSLRQAARLCNDLELEGPAMALVLSFVERIRDLEAQLRHLRAQLAAPRR